MMVAMSVYLSKNYERILNYTVHSRLEVTYVRKQKMTKSVNQDNL